MAFGLTVGYLTFISDLKLEDHFPRLEKFVPERYLETRFLTIGIVLFILVDSFYTDPGYHEPPTAGYGQRGLNSE